MESGTRLGPYEILGPLGTGGMGEVYRARDTTLDRDVAIKVLPDDLTSDTERLARLEREAKLLAAVPHANIAAVYGFGHAAAGPYIAMELVDGQPLSAVLADGALRAEQALDIARQIASALEAAHDRGVVHRDLKPANVLITPEGHAKVLDFGIAKSTVLPDGEQEKAERSTTLTTAGAVVGTPRYMSPEQVRGEPVDAQSDVFAFGAVLFEMLTGRAAFGGATIADTNAAVLERDPDWSALPASLDPTIPPLLERCLRKDRRSRWHQIADVRAQIEEGTGPVTIERPVVASPTKSGAARRPWAMAAVTGGLVTILAVVAGFWLVGERGAGTPDEVETGAVSEVPEHSIAVLAFADMSPEKDQEYFADGVAEELLNILVQIEALQVAARTSSFSFKGKDVDIATIGEQLGVATVLEGSVRKAGNRLRITAQLIKASDGFHLWSQTYERELDDVFAVQDDIARSVAEALQVTLLGEGSLGRSRSEDGEAYSLFLQARHFARLRRGPEDFDRAIRYAEQALELDENYAPAWVALGYALNNQGERGYVDRQVALGESLEAIRRAIELDEGSAEAWAVLAEINMELEWEWGEAEDALRRAEELEPNNPEVLRRQGELAHVQGRLEDAIRYARRAMEFDPMNYLAVMNLHDALVDAHRFDEAQEALDRTRELEPNGFYVRQVLFDLVRGEPEKALEEILAIPAGAIPEAARKQYLAMTLHDLGRHEEADELSQEVVRALAETDASRLAQLAAYRGEVDRAFEWLDVAIDRRESGLRWVKTIPILANLHGDPRWQEFLGRMGLAD